MKLSSRFFYYGRKSLKAFRIFLLIIGPGIIVMVADNDAGGITTYAATGAKYGYSFIWVLLLLIPTVYVVQELTMRVGVVTKRGFAEAVFQGFGARWGWFALANLLVACWLTLATEYIGVTAALGILGVKPWVSVLGVWLMLGAMVMSGRYWTWEKIALLLCSVNFIYVPAALMAKPDFSEVLHQGLMPHIPGGKLTGGFVLFLLANIGTTITTWQICFQQSAVVDKELSEKDIAWSRVETFLGSCLTCFVAIFIVVLTGSLMYPHAPVETAEAASLWIMKHHSHTIGACLAIGLMNAGLLGAICLSVSVSWAFGEVFGWAHSLNANVREAPLFYIFYVLLFVTSGLFVLAAPKAALMYVVLFVQVVAVVMLPAALVFLILIANDKTTMGKWANTRRDNLMAWSVALMIITMSTAYGVLVMFPGLLPVK